MEMWPEGKKAKAARALPPLPPTPDHETVLACKCWAPPKPRPLGPAINKAQLLRRQEGKPYWENSRLVDHVAGCSMIRCSKCGWLWRFTRHPKKALKALIAGHKKDCWKEG